mmetsp:Transcript_44239/g.96525  ORF Transcript_44239/g.96525 Transcript_44239/m.96525 type:complete len:215 (-) Transcript_44239:166-810(-)
MHVRRLRHRRTWRPGEDCEQGARGRVVAGDGLSLQRASPPELHGRDVWLDGLRRCGDRFGGDGGRRLQVRSCVDRRVALRSARHQFRPRAGGDWARDAAARQVRRDGRVQALGLALMGGRHAAPKAQAELNRADARMRYAFLYVSDFGNEDCGHNLMSKRANEICSFAPFRILKTHVLPQPGEQMRAREVFSGKCSDFGSAHGCRNLMRKKHTK